MSVILRSTIKHLPFTQEHINEGVNETVGANQGDEPSLIVSAKFLTVLHVDRVDERAYRFLR